MTTAILLLLAGGVILIVSAIETDPATGKSISVLQTIADIWNNKVDFSQPTVTSPPTSSAAMQGAGGAQALRDSAVQAWLQARMRG